MDKQPGLKLRISIQTYDEKRQQYIPRRNLRFVLSDPRAASGQVRDATGSAISEVLATESATWSEI